MDREKKIEEMARLIKLPIENWLEDTGVIPQATTYYAELMACINDSAEVLFNENYRKINENEIIIDRSEHLKLCKECDSKIQEVINELELKLCKYHEFNHNLIVENQTLKDKLELKGKETAED